VLEYALAVAEGIAGLAPLTLRASKEMVRRVRAETPVPPDEDLIRACYGSDDFRAGVTAFLAKRSPDWRGR
jgi:enoyl-CoA hydratase/carnithine racemase